MAFYTFIYAPKQTQLSWVWDMLLITNSTQIFREYVHFTFREKRPTLLYKIFLVSCFDEKWLIQCCRAATGRVIHISDGTRTGSARAPEGIRAASGDTVRYPLYLFTKIGKNNRAVLGRYPGGALMRPSESCTDCSLAAGFMKTLGELGTASSTNRRPYGLLKLSRHPWNRKGAGRAPYGNSKHIRFYSPYGALEWFVKAP